MSELGSKQAWDPERYACHAGFVPELGKDVVALLDAQPGERILDLGCGDGVLTREIARTGARVVGVDLSEPQARAARASGLPAFVASAESIALARPFDAVFSNAALHWVKRAEAALESVRVALRPGGRFVGEMGARGNVASVRAALRAAVEGHGIDAEAIDPWYFPSHEEYAEKLAAHGFEVEQLLVFERPTPLSGDVREWLLTFGQAFLAAVERQQREGLLGEVRERVRPTLQRADGSWVVDYVRLRFRALRR